MGSMMCFVLQLDIKHVDMTMFKCHPPQVEAIHGHVGRTSSSWSYTLTASGFQKLKLKPFLQLK